MTEFILDDDEAEEIVQEQRHKELLKALSRIAVNTQEKPNDDIAKLLSKNSDLISTFVEKMAKPVQPQSVEINFDSLAAEMRGLISSVSEIMQGINTRLELLETKPLPTKMKAVKDKYGNIDYVTIEYK